MPADSSAHNGSDNREDKPLNLSPPVTITLAEMYVILNTKGRTFSEYYNGGTSVDYPIRIIPGRYDGERPYEKDDAESLSKLIASDILSRKLVSEGKSSIAASGNDLSLSLNLKVHSKTRWLLFEYIKNFNYLHPESMHSIGFLDYNGKRQPCVPNLQYSKKCVFSLGVDSNDSNNVAKFIEQFSRELSLKSMARTSIGQIDWKSPENFILEMRLSDRQGIQDLVDQYISMYNLTHEQTELNSRRRNRSSAVDIVSAELLE